MLNSKPLSLVNKIGDKTEFTITRVHCTGNVNCMLIFPDNTKEMPSQMSIQARVGRWSKKGQHLVILVKECLPLQQLVGVNQGCEQISIMW